MLIYSEHDHIFFQSYALSQMAWVNGSRKVVLHAGFEEITDSYEIHIIFTIVPILWRLPL